MSATLFSTVFCFIRSLAPFFSLKFFFINNKTNLEQSTNQDNKRERARETEEREMGKEKKRKRHYKRTTVIDNDS